MNLVDIFFRKKNSKNDSVLPSENEGIIIKEFSEKFGITFSDPKLLINALKHRSYLNVTNEDRVASNERLEFLGDAVLDLIVTHYLFVKFPKRTEGQLSKIKSTQILIQIFPLRIITRRVPSGEPGRRKNRWAKATVHPCGYIRGYHRRHIS